MNMPKCPRCGYIHEIVFNVKSHDLQSMVVNFNCHKCKLPGQLVVMFDNVDDKPKVTWEDTNYIG